MRSNLAYKAKELSPRTWPDFERLFAKHGGVQAGCWCMFYHRPAPIDREERENLNRRDKEALVKQNRSHGILVYAGDQAVGWCQYGSKAELPRIDSGRNYRKLDLPKAEAKLWRITCFFIDRDFRRKGVATVALRAALDAIRAEGGGIVEAYPVTSKSAVATWFGTEAMFEREKFRKVDDLGKSNIVMRRRVIGRGV